MPKIRHSRTKKAPEGFEDIESVLSEFAQKMKDAENEPHEGKRRVESLWPIFRLHHQRSRYIYDLYYKREAISKDVYEYCLKNGYADGNLIAKWKKPGFERLCCLRCIQPRDTNFGTTCICRVPKSKLEEGRVVECVLCGCRGCSSTDFTFIKKGQKSKQKRLQEGQEGEDVEGEGMEEQHQRQLNQYVAAQQETYGESSSSQSTLAVNSTTSLETIYNPNITQKTINLWLYFRLASICASSKTISTISISLRVSSITSGSSIAIMNSSI